jgi:hypothetical protein
MGVNEKISVSGRRTYHSWNQVKNKNTCFPEVVNTKYFIQIHQEQC